jgi:hypothetical protein
VAVLSCAGAYVSGADGSNACPAGSVRIEAEATCRTAAAAAGKSFRFVVTWSSSPRGCYYTINYDYAFFNKPADAVGAGDRGLQLLCAVTTGARAPNRRGTRRVLKGHSMGTRRALQGSGETASRT